jgi:hypothetical protein
MNEKLYSINEIVKWYNLNVDTQITDDFLIFLITKGIIKPIETSLYSLNEVNNFLLKKYNNDLLKNDNNKFILKENRIQLLNKFPKKEIKKPKKFKITSLDGNKMKLIKLN